MMIGHKLLWLLGVLTLTALMGRRRLREHHGLVRSHHGHSSENVTDGI